MMCVDIIRKTSARIEEIIKFQGTEFEYPEGELKRVMKEGLESFRVALATDRHISQREEALSGLSWEERMAEAWSGDSTI